MMNDTPGMKKRAAISRRLSLVLDVFAGVSSPQRNPRIRGRDSWQGQRIGALSASADSSKASSYPLLL